MAPELAGMTRLLDWLFPWRVLKRDLETTRQELAETNRVLARLITALEDRVAKLPEMRE